MATLTTDLSLYTYQDAIDRLTDYISGNATAASMRAVKQSVVEAYDEIVNARNWRYYQSQFRVATLEPETGTCSYSSSTGQFTIDADTWPTWAELAVVEIDGVRYLIKTRDSGTVLTADDTMRPIDDIDAGTAFSIYKCIYSLPYDFRAMGRLRDEDNDLWCQNISLDQWLEMGRYSAGSSGSPYAFAISAHPYEIGRMCIFTHPTPESARTIDFSYQRYPRRLRYNGFDSPCRTGTITASASTSVTGGSSLFESDMVGAVLRFGRDTASYPDGVGGINAYKQQVYVTGYSSATAITVSSAITVSAGKYTISDPLDLDRPMLDAFWRGCERKLSQKLKLAGLDACELAYSQSLSKARQSDAKSYHGRSPWDAVPGSVRRCGTNGPDDFQ